MRLKLEKKLVLKMLVELQPKSGQKCINIKDYWSNFSITTRGNTVTNTRIKAPAVHVSSWFGWSCLPKKCAVSAVFIKIHATKVETSKCSERISRITQTNRIGSCSVVFLPAKKSLQVETDFSVLIKKCFGYRWVNAFLCFASKSMQLELVI